MASLRRNKLPDSKVPGYATPSLFEEMPGPANAPAAQRQTEQEANQASYVEINKAETVGTVIPRRGLLFGIAEADLQRIDPVNRLLALANTNQETVGDWGILYVCCGAKAGQTEHWRSEIIDQLNVPVTEAYVYHLLGKPDGEYCAILFSKMIREWAVGEIAVAGAAKAIQGATPPLDATARAMYRPYFQLAISLNSFAGCDGSLFGEEREQIWTWVTLEEASRRGLDHEASHPSPWAQLFFAAGLLLSNDAQFRWENVLTAIRTANVPARRALKDLLDRMLLSGTALAAPAAPDSTRTELTP